MPEKQPTEGFMMKLSDDDDVEGHVMLKAVDEGDDVEGHRQHRHKAIEDEADVEGHVFQYRGPTSRGE